MNARDQLRRMTIQGVQDLGATKPGFQELLALRRDAYAEHLGLMTVPEPLRKWASLMTATVQASDPHMRLRVGHLVLPCAPSSWLIALLIVRYGEALRVKRDRLPVTHPEHGDDDGTLVDFWPLSFSAADMRRAQQWLQGETPRRVRYLSGMEPDDAPGKGGLGTLSTLAPWLLAILGGLVSAWGILADSAWGLIGFAPLLGSAMTDYLEVQMRTHLFRTGLTTVPAWSASTAYSVDDIVRPTTWNDRLFQVVVAGTSAGSEPTWDTVIGEETTDNTVTWLTIAVGLPKRAHFLALFTAAPGETGGGTEVTGGSYARVKSIPLDANWTAVSATDGLTDNAGDLTYPAPTGNWGTVTDFADMDRATGGNMTIYGELTTPKTVNDSDPAPKFSAGDLDFTFA